MCAKKGCATISFVFLSPSHHTPLSIHPAKFGPVYIIIGRVILIPLYPSPFFDSPYTHPASSLPPKKIERGFWVSRGGGRRPHRTQVARHIIPSSPRTLKRAHTHISHPQKKRPRKKKEKPRTDQTYESGGKKKKKTKKKANESTLRKNLTKKRGRKRDAKKRALTFGANSFPPQKKTPGFQIRGCRRQKLEGKDFFWKEKGRSSMKKKLKRKKRR